MTRVTRAALIEPIRTQVYASQEREAFPMPYAQCSECGQTILVEMVSNDVMMMWNGIHCGSSQTYFADKDIFETGDKSREEESNLDLTKTTTASISRDVGS